MAKKKRNKQVQLPSSPEKYIRNRCRDLPIGECLITENWEEDGIAQIIITREHSNGNLTVGFFIIDLYCLGLKDAFYRFNFSTIEFGDLFEEFSEELVFVPIEYTLAHNIIYGAIEYAEDYGFSPVKDFLKTTQYILEEDNDNVELMDVEFGYEGKPFLVVTNESEPYKNYLRTLDETAGPGNYDFLLPSGESSEEDDGFEDDKEYYDFLEPIRFDDDIEERIEQELIKIELWDKKDWDEARSGKIDLHEETSIRMTEIAFADQFTQEELKEAYNFGEKLFDLDIDYENSMNEEDVLPDDLDMDSYYDALKILSEGKPKEALRILKRLTAKHPDKPMLLNYMVTCLLLNKKSRKADDLAIYAYQRFPNHLNIKIQYLWHLIRQNRYEEFEKVLENKYALQDIYPEKVSFPENHAINYFKAIFSFLIGSKQILKAKAVLYKLKTHDLNEEEEDMLNTFLLYATDDFINNITTDNKQKDKN